MSPTGLISANNTMAPGGNRNTQQATFGLIKLPANTFYTYIYFDVTSAQMVNARNFSNWGTSSNIFFPSARLNF